MIIWFSIRVNASLLQINGVTPGLARAKIRNFAIITAAKNAPTIIIHWV
ncbi:hypothetical protein [Streptosporangium sp. NBC_01756]|nr:hypothetical protein [Streptosporangium sp. NBC_01756]WSC83939.1 hypothetical protein OIE48_26525 [Streptosporangium sp. NBC_01756]